MHYCFQAFVKIECTKHSVMKFCFKLRNHVFHTDSSGRKRLVICCGPQRPDNSGRSVSWLNQCAWVNIASFMPWFTALALNLQAHTYRTPCSFTLEQVEKSCTEHFDNSSHRMRLALTICKRNNSSRAAVKYKHMTMALLCLIVMQILPVAVLSGSYCLLRVNQCGRMKVKEGVS